MFSRISKRTIDSNNNIQMNINMYKRPTLKQITTNKPKETPRVSQPEKSQKQGMQWGKHVWYFLHTFIEKVKNSEFETVRTDILKFIFQICTNLPCPLCSEHARTHLNGINFNSLQTKEQIKMTLFNFHNMLNKQKGYIIFTQAELSKYSSADFKKVIINFFNAYMERNNNLRMMNHNLHRSIIIKELKIWFSHNQNKFNF